MFRVSTRLGRCDVKSMHLIFKTEMLIYQSRANSDVQILFGKITRLLDPEIRKLLVSGFVWNENSIFSLGP